MCISFHVFEREIKLTCFHVSSSLNEKSQIEKMDARSRKIVGPGDAPRRIGCNCGGVVLEAEKVEILGKKNSITKYS